MDIDNKLYLKQQTQIYYYHSNISYNNSLCVTSLRDSKITKFYFTSQNHKDLSLRLLHRDDSSWVVGPPRHTVTCLVHTSMWMQHISMWM